MLSNPARTQLVTAPPHRCAVLLDIVVILYECVQRLLCLECALLRGKWQQELKKNDNGVACRPMFHECTVLTSLFQIEYTLPPYQELC